MIDGRGCDHRLEVRLGPYIRSRIDTPTARPDLLAKRHVLSICPLWKAEKITVYMLVEEKR